MEATRRSGGRWPWPFGLPRQGIAPRVSGALGGGVLPPPPAEGDGGDDAPMSAAEVAKVHGFAPVLRPQAPVRTSGLGARVGVASYSTTSRMTYDSPGAYSKTGAYSEDDHPPRRWIRDQGSKRPPAATDALGGTFAPPRELFRGSPYSARNSPKPRDVGPKPWDAPLADRVVPASERFNPGPEWFQDARHAWIRARSLSCG